MKNQRRRKEQLLLVTLLSMSHKLPRKQAYAHYAPILYRYINLYDDAFKKEVPSDAKRNSELEAVKKLVNGILPANHGSYSQELWLWIAVQILYRLVADGWQPPREDLGRDLVQAMYLCSQSFNMTEQVPQSVMNAVVLAPAKLRAQGMFKNG